MCLTANPEYFYLSRIQLKNFSFERTEDKILRTCCRTERSTGPRGREKMLHHV